MCGIAGFCAFDRDLSGPEWTAVGRSMGQALARRGPDDWGLWQNERCVLAHRRLAVMDPERGKQPMERNLGTARYTICYNGEIYNTNELRQTLLGLGWRFSTTSDTEVVLCAYIEYGEEVGRHLEGIYAFALWDGLRRQLFCCRDRFGVKPFFYAWSGTAFVFGSEPKALFAFPGLAPRADDDTWRELLGIAPARTAGQGVFAGVKELPPACCMTVDEAGARTARYWALESRPHEESYPDTAAHVRELLCGAIRRQLASDVPLCCFLSGGLDSSLITAVAAGEYARRGLPPLETYSFDYTDNRKFFRPSAFQPDADWPWVERMCQELGTRHTVLTCGIPDLVELLDDAVWARDLPGMADVDSSLLYFCRQVARRHVVALSGECSDEIFGGYPWFHRPDMLAAEGFPWSMDLSVRADVFAPDLWRRLEVEEYVRQRCRASAEQTPRLEGETGLEARRREVAWLNLNWFMATLLERKDRMSMYSGLEVRVPFCDHHLVEYVWNIPWEMKSRDGVRKQLLRDAAEGLLPEDVRNRPKSPYPKTHNPLYERLVRARLKTLLEDPAAPIHGVVNKAALEEGLLRDGGDYGRPWFGQLMAGPQLMAYLLQLDQWMERFGLAV